jgi:hypothetical protein
MNNHDLEQVRQLAARVRVAAPSVDAHALAATTLDLLDRLQRLQKECAETHRHYCEATHGEWREKARADRAEDQVAELLLAQHHAELPPLAVA